MRKARTIVPLAALALLASALLQSPSAQTTSETEKHRDSAPAESAARSHTRTDAAADDPFSALDVLAESFGVDVSREGLKRMVMREARFARSDDLNDRWREALEFLDYLPASVKVPVFDPSDRGDAETLNRAITRVFQREELDTTDLRFKALRHVARRQNTDVSFLIATLPDPIDSFTGWQFDPMLDAISQAVSASDYLFERFRFPDSEPGDSKDRHGRGRGHEDDSSVVLYRRHIEPHFQEAGTDATSAPWRRERPVLVLLIVHENPSAGVHATALVNAIRLVTRWFGRDPQAHENTIRILGPTFSGSADSIARDLAQADRRHLLDNYSVRVISGSATDDTNRDVLEGAVSGRIDPDENGWPVDPQNARVTFHATVQPDRALLPILIEQVRRAGWSFPIAVLFEGNTQYGRSLRRALTETRLLKPEEMIMLPFPMNISRVRDTAQDEKHGLSGALGLPSRFRPLAMESVGKPADQIPQLWPKTTSSYVELAISGILQTMRTERVGTVALMATDPRDKLFLARQIRRDSPNVCILTAESDSLYVHPDYSSYLHGALVASTYPLYSGNQRWSYGFQGSTERREFSSGSAKGIYNAALALLNYDRDGRLIRSYAPGEEPPRLLEYGPPGQGCSLGCQPPVWITVVGRKSEWPVQARDQRDSYVLPIRMDTPEPPQRLATFPSPSFTAVVIVLTGLALWCWAGIRVPWWRRTTGFRCRPAALATEGAPESGRPYLLVAVVSLLTMEAFLAAVCVARLRLDAAHWVESSPWFAVAVGLMVLAVLALVDLAIQIVRRMVTHDRASLGERFDLTKVAGWGRLAAVIFCTGTVASVLGYAVTEAFQPRETALSFATRAVDLASGVSPTLPVLFLCAALMLWSLAELARLRSPAVALTDTAVRPLMQQTVSGDLDQMTQDWALLNRSTVVVPRALAIIAPMMVVATCLFVFDPIIRPLVTIDGPWFGRLISAGILIVQVMITLSLLQFVYLWIVLRHLLRRIASHNAAPAYEQVPRALFPAGLFPSLPTLMEIEIIVQHWQGCLERSGQVEEAAAIRQSFANEMAKGRWPYWSGSQTWHSLALAAGIRSDAQGTPPAAEHSLLEQMCGALVIRDAIARLWHNLVFVIGGVLFVFCSHTLFPFQMQSRLSELGWAYVAATFGAILMVLIQMKRNDILHRLTSPDPTQRTGWDTSFVWQVAVFALLPLLTLFTAQFPNAGQVLLKWVDPMRQLLP